MVKFTFTHSALTFLATLALFSAHAAPADLDDATALAAAAGPGQTGALISAKEYCLFLPPKFGGDISDHEDDALAFCNKAIPSAPGAKLLPVGFIKSLHFVNNTAKGYVQITGRIDRAKYGLSKNDGGGQYDIKAPVGAKCAGYGYFVELVEPDVEIYCLRCCKTKADCPVNKSTYGCKKVLGGDYS